MLTEAEEKWLERRKVLCTHCDLIARGFCKGEKNKTSCKLWEDLHCENPVSGYKAFQSMQDAAEFEARVAQRSVQNISWPCYVGLCPEGKDMDWQICPKEEWCHMKYARLAVEQEMDDVDRS